MIDLTPIIQNYLPESELDKSVINGTEIYEYTNTPSNRERRGQLLDGIIDDLKQEKFASDYFIERKTTAKVGTKSFSSGDKQNPLLLLIRDSDRRGSKILALVKLIPRPKFSLTPKKLGITRSGKPSSVSSYLSFDEVINTINERIDEYSKNEKITEALAEWVKVHLAMFNPSDFSSGKRQRIRDVWSAGLKDEITSELLEIFCGMGYIKAITTPFNNQGAIISISERERQRVRELIGTNSPNLSSFKVWFPDISNYPIIDCQVGYFENGVLKAAFPISTKNITGGRTPNTIKFGDIFKNKKQVLKWKKKLASDVSHKQGVQTIVASQAVGQPYRQGTIYPIYAAKSILNSSISNANDKRILIQNINEYGAQIPDSEIKRLLSSLTSSRHSIQDKLHNILTGKQLSVAKELVYVLLENTRGTASPYSAVVKKFDKQFLIECDEDQWNSVVKGKNGPKYPYTYGNISLFFEKVLETNSVNDAGQRGPTDYHTMVVSSYFIGNKSLLSKYGDDLPPAGAGDVIVAKVDIRQDGIAQIGYDTRVIQKPHYGLRSKNSLNNLQDALGIAP